MKKFLLIIISITVTIFIASSCDSQNEDSCRIPMNVDSLSKDIKYTDTIHSYSTLYYKFNITASGNYGIYLTGLDSEYDWELFEYADNDCYDFYEDNFDDYYIEFGLYDDFNKEAVEAGIYLPVGSYLLVVDEWDGITNDFIIEIVTE